MPEQLTVSEQVLIALAVASGGTTDAVPYEEIVIASWRRFPGRFSLRNHPEYPDASDQHKQLYGSLKRAGFVTAIEGAKAFRLTDRGLEQAVRLDPSLAQEE